MFHSHTPHISPSVRPWCRARSYENLTHTNSTLSRHLCLWAFRTGPATVGEAQSTRFKAADGFLFQAVDTTWSLRGPNQASLYGLPAGQFRQQMFPLRYSRPSLQWTERRVLLPLGMRSGDGDTDVSAKSPINKQITFEKTEGGSNQHIKR